MFNFYESALYFRGESGPPPLDLSGLQGITLTDDSHLRNRFNLAADGKSYSAQDVVDTAASGVLFLDAYQSFSNLSGTPADLNEPVKLVREYVSSDRVEHDPNDDQFLPTLIDLGSTLALDFPYPARLYSPQYTDKKVMVLGIESGVLILEVDTDEGFSSYQLSLTNDKVINCFIGDFDENQQEQLESYCLVSGSQPGYMSGKTNFGSFLRNLNISDLVNVGNAADWDFSSGVDFNRTLIQNNFDEVPLGWDFSNGEIFFDFLTQTNITAIDPNWRFPNAQFCEGMLRRNNLQTFPPNIFDNCQCTDYEDALSDNQIDRQGIDNYLESVKTAAETFNLNDGVIDVTIGNSGPGETGILAIKVLEDRSWSVSTEKDLFLDFSSLPNAADFGINRRWDFQKAAVLAANGATGSAQDIINLLGTANRFIDWRQSYKDGSGGRAVLGDSVQSVYDHAAGNYFNQFNVTNKPLYDDGLLFGPNKGLIRSVSAPFDTANQIFIMSLIRKDSSSSTFESGPFTITDGVNPRPIDRYNDIGYIDETLPAAVPSGTFQDVRSISTSSKTVFASETTSDSTWRERFYPNDGLLKFYTHGQKFSHSGSPQEIIGNRGSMDIGFNGYIYYVLAWNNSFLGSNDEILIRRFMLALEGEL